MFEIFRVDEEILSTEEGSALAVVKDFSGLREKYCNESLSNEVKISFDFAFIFIEEVSMMSSRKEEVVISSTKILSSE